MNPEDKKAIIALPTVLAVAGLLSWAGSQGSALIFGMPLFALCVGIAFIIQWIVFIPSYLAQTEKYFDLTGSFTYITVVITAAFLGPGADTRIWLLTGLVVVWATRLGSFLFMRIRADGEDRRFREIKTSFPRFFLTWSLQGLWVSFTLAAALAAMTSAFQVKLGAFAIIGSLVWLLGFTIEVIADRQKSQFKRDPANKDQFIQSGLWAWSRHPNYFGEIVLWIGVAIIALPILQGWQWITLISPIFVFILLTRVSGVPMLERRADKKWGGQEHYEYYKANTPVLVLRPPKRG